MTATDTMTQAWPESSPLERLPPGAVGSVPQLPQAPKTPRVRRRWPIKRLLKNLIGAALIAVVLFLIHDRVITTLIFQQRQQHLSAEMKGGTPTIEDGEAVAIIQAVDIDLNVVVVEGVTAENLRGGPARASASALPGDAGVAVVFGHRRAYGGPFERIDELANGQSIVVQTRSGGPITRYIVDRVEKGSSLAAVELSNEDVIAYLLLVTNESSWTSNEQTIVIARALPVTDSEATTPQLAALTARGLPYGLDTLVAALAGLAAALSWVFLRGRTGLAIRIAVVAPSSIYCVIGVLSTLDSLLPLAR